MEQDVVGSFLRGEPEAVFRIARWVGLELRASCASRSGMYRDDLLQEGMLRVFRALHSGNFRGESGLEHYVRSVARHAFLDHLRRSALGAVTEAGDPATWEDGAPAVDESVAAGEIADRLIAALPAEDGRLLVEAYVLERPYSEMAAARGIAPNALKVRVFRAVRRAREILAKLGLGPEGGRR